MSVSTRIRRKIYLILSLVAAICILGVLALSLLLSDDLKFKDGGATYHLVVRSPTIRNFPRLGAGDRAAEFRYQARDGTSPAVFRMDYASATGATDLESGYRAYCRRSGYAEVPRSERFLKSDGACEAPDFRIEIQLRRVNGDTGVSIFFFEQ